MNALLEVDDLTITATVDGSDRVLVEGLDLEVAAGETVGIVGESGSGTSLTARAVAGLVPRGLRAEGSITFDGRQVLGASGRELRSFRGADTTLLFQDPFTMLNPLLRCWDIVTETLRGEDGRRPSKKARREEAVRRLAEVGIGDPQVANQYPFQLSGGMRQRVGIAAALARNPRLLIADEPTTALDVTTQREILTLLKSIQEARGMGLILITHDLRVAFSMCDRIHVMYAGAAHEVGSAAQLDAEPLHPYTLGLLLSEPSVEHRQDRLDSLPGSFRAGDRLADGCSFAPRCRWAEPACTTTAVTLRPLDDGRWSACRRLEEIRPEMSALRAAAEDQAAGDDVSTGGRELISVEGLVKTYASGGRGGRQHEVRALRGVSVSVGAGASIGLVGESGSGKTTLARCLAGLERPTSGRIQLDGVDASRPESLTPQQRRELRRTIQMVFQDPYSSLNPSHTIGSTLGEAVRIAEPQQRRSTESRVQELLERVGLPAEYARRKPVALSGGERQRVAIARALAIGPQVLLCDEPVSALDVSVQAQILNLFNDLRTELGLSYLFITHDLAVVRQVVDFVYVMYRGEVVESGPTDQILTNPEHPYTARLLQAVPRSDASWLEPVAEPQPSSTARP